MKRGLLFAMMVIISGALSAQETITGWNFPVNTGTDSLNANMGSTTNKSYDLRFQWVLTPTTDSTLNTITFVNGATTYAAATTGWAGGADVKFWSVKFKASNYTNFKVSSKQKSDATGPRDFKLQWRLSSGTYADVTGGTITLGSDWTTGVVADLPVPITGQGTGSIYIRWIMTSNNDITGGTVAPAGQSMIDDILVTAVSSTGQNEILFTNRLKVFPSPNNGTFNISSTEPLDFMSVTDIHGKAIVTMAAPSQNQAVSMPYAKPGLYLLKVKFSGSDREYSTCFVVE
ncbi:MAG: T9SS type A sorting domain-containing protein [Bacteroidetes bacterium]|nr:T9SS type A sorting domain-containing protein [Bacteroidota bacterium]